MPSVPLFERIDNFLLYSLEEIISELDSFCSKYVDYDAKISDDSAIKEFLDRYLSILDDFEIPNLKDTQLAWKYLGHINRVSGLISEKSSVAKRVKEQIEAIKAGLETKQIPDSIYSTEGWSLRPFLILRLCFLLKIRIEVTRPDFRNDIGKDRLKNFIDKEIMISINTLLINNICEEIYKKPENLDLLEVFVDRLLISVKKVLKREFDLACIPCGFEGHAVYLIFFKRNDKIVIRVDNVGRGALPELHVYDEGQDKYHPNYLAQIPINKLIEHREFRNYLKQVFLVMRDAEEKACDIINNKYLNGGDRINLGGRPKDDFGYKPLKQQIVGNCVVENFSVGVQYRSYFYDGSIIDNTSIFGWFLQKESCFIGYQWTHNGSWLKSALEKLEDIGQPPAEFSNYVPKIERLIFYREKIQRQLDENFNTPFSSIPCIVVCHGLGGHGKTTAALNYYKNSKIKYKFRAWFTADRLDEGYHKFCATLKIFSRNFSLDNISLENVRKEVHKWFSENNDWLLVYEDVSDVKELKKFLPETGRGHILVTSAERPLDFGNESVSVDMFSQEEAQIQVKKFITHYKMDEFAIKNENSILGLINEFKMPLVLFNVMSHIQQQVQMNSGFSIDSYLEELKRSYTKLMDQKFFTIFSSTDKSVAETWHTNMNAIEKKSPVALWVLENCAYLGTKGIPRIILERLVFYYPKKKYKKFFFGEEDLNLTLNLLERYSLITFQSDDEKINILEIHQKFIRWHDDNMADCESFEKWSYRRLEYLVKILYEIYPFYKKIDENRDDYSLALSLYPHVEAVKEHLINLLKLVPEGSDKIFLQTLLGQILAILGDLCIKILSKQRDGLDYTQQALFILKEKLQKFPILYNNMGVAYNWLSQFQASLQCYEKALFLFSLEDKEETKLTAELANTYNGRGITQWRLGKYDDALQSHYKALSIRRNLYGEKSMNVADSYINLGLVYKALGKIQNALELYHKAHQIRLTICHDENHQIMANSYSNLAAGYLYLGEFNQALEFAQKAVYIVAEIYNQKKNLETILYESGVGRIKLESSKVQDVYEAYEIHQRLSKDIETLNIKGKELAANYFDLGNVQKNLGQIHEALSNFEKAYQIYEKLYTKLHALTANCIEKIAVCKQLLGNFQSSIDQLNSVLNLRIQIYKTAEHPDVGSSFEALGDSYREVDQIEAKKNYTKALQIYQHFKLTKRVERIQKKLDGLKIEMPVSALAKYSVLTTNKLSGFQRSPVILAKL